MAATGKKNGKTVVVALGGNAILQPGQVGTFEEQLFNIDGAMRRIAQLVEDGWRVVLTHGNGPQVGLLALGATAAGAADNLVAKFDYFTITPDSTADTSAGDSR